MSIMAVMGSLYVFSIFLVPWEQLLGASRSDVSSIFSVAAVMTTVGIFIGYKLYPLLPPPTFAATVCLVAAGGVALAGTATSLPPIWLGYGVLFGGANGIGYGFAIQIAAQAMPERKGFAIGATAAFYAVGTALAPPALQWALDAGGIAAAMNLLAAAFVVIGLFAGVLLKISGARFEPEPRDKSARARKGSATTEGILWLGYGTAAAAGVMAIGHGAGIVAAAGGTAAYAIAGPTLIAAGYMIGGLTAGWLADRVPVRALLTVLPVLSSGVLLLLAHGGSPVYVLACLGLLGMTYGALVVVYPTAVAVYFGILAGGRIYGRVCIAWGVAGFAAPWFAGLLFDRTGSYGTALMVAAAAGIASALAVRLLPKQGRAVDSWAET
jgi:MFS family permease